MRSFPFGVNSYGATLLFSAAIVLGAASIPSTASQQSPDEGVAEKRDQDSPWRAVQIEHDERSRTYVVYVPDSYDKKRPAPLVLFLHGTAKSPRLDPVKSAKGLIRWARFDLKSEDEGFITVAPLALGLAFNEGSGRGGAQFEDVDDVGFLDAVIADSIRRFAIDENRVYVAGISSGASMAERLAIELPGPIAAFAGVHGHLWIAGRSPAISRSIFLMFGTGDPLNPIDGGKVAYKTGALDKPAPEVSAANWASRLNCSTDPAHISAEENVRMVTWRPCDNGSEVVYYAIDGLGHQWPGGTPFPDEWKWWAGEYTDAVDATDLIWKFFVRHKRN